MLQELQENLNLILSIATGVVFIIVIFLIFYRKSKKGLEPETRETFSMTDALSFFRQEEVLKKLRENESSLAVAVKNKLKSGETELTLTIFDKKLNEVMEPLAIYRIKDVSEDLMQAFGNNDMIVLK